MSRVLPGVDDVIASLELPVSILMRLDLPTFDLPMNAYSGIFPSGHFDTSVLLMMNSALRISIVIQAMIARRYFLFAIFILNSHNLSICRYDR